MNKKELINDLYGEGYFPTKKAAGECLEYMLAKIGETIASGNEVRLGGFGKFEKYTRTNGKTTPKFRAYEALKTTVG